MAKKDQMEKVEEQVINKPARTADKASSGSKKRKKIQTEVEESANAVIALTDVETNDRLLSFSECGDRLKEFGIDLEKERTKAVKSALRWGLVDEKTMGEYSESLKNIEISEREMQEVVQQMKKNPKIEVILGVDNFTPDESYRILFKSPDPDKDFLSKHVSWNFPEYQRVDPKTCQPLNNQKPTGKAGILFAPKDLKIPHKLMGKSPNEYLKNMESGQKYLGPVGWMFLFRKLLDAALQEIYPKDAANLDNLQPEEYKALIIKALINSKLDYHVIDRSTATIFPDFRDNGNEIVPTLEFFADFENSPIFGKDAIGVNLRCVEPKAVNRYRGARPVLGTFLV
jgi:hypothetical protein